MSEVCAWISSESPASQVKIEDPTLVVKAEDFAENSELKLSSGKKKHGIIELQSS